MTSILCDSTSSLRGGIERLVGEVIEVIWGSDAVEEPWRGCGLPPGREAEARPPVTTRQVDKSPLTFYPRTS